MDIGEHPARDEPSFSDDIRQDPHPLNSPWGGHSFARDDFDFNLEPLNELPRLEPRENILSTGVPPAITNSPPIPTRVLECDTQTCSLRGENSQHMKLVSHDQYPNRREVLRPLQNFNLPLPVFSKETERQRSTRGLSGKLKRRKKSSAK